MLTCVRTGCQHSHGSAVLCLLLLLLLSCVRLVVTSTLQLLRPCLLRVCYVWNSEAATFAVCRPRPVDSDVAGMQASSIEECCEWAIALRESIALSSSAGGAGGGVSRTGSGISGRH